MAIEWFQPPRKTDSDETVASLVERHYGAEMVDRLADPLLSGVYGGEASQLGVRAVLPRFAELEEIHGSLGRGMLRARKKVTQVARGPAKPLFTSLKNGMQQMVDTIGSRLDSSVFRLGTGVRGLQRKESGWIVSAGDVGEHFDAAILAIPAHAAAKLVNVASPNLASELRTIEYTSSITINLGYEDGVRSSLPAGFGFLVPRTEKRRLLAATFVHNKFPHRAPPDRALLRCFIAGTHNEQILQLPDDEIVNVVREELRQILGLTADPQFTRVHRWMGAMAQYGVGHLERVQRIENLLGQLPGLALAGNAYRGIGVPDCVRSGTDAAHRALAAVGLTAARIPTTA